MRTPRKSSAPKVLARTATLSDRIYDEVRRRLQQAPLKADERLIDVELAAAYGTSRMPARDALLRLVNEGYLVGTTRGFVAPTLSRDDVRDIFEVRRLLEPAAIAMVANQIDAATVAQLAKALDRARQAAIDGDGDEMMLANMEFRAAWLKQVKNKRLAATIGRFVDHVQTVRLYTLNSEATRGVVLDGLEGLYAALTTGNAAQASKRMKSFMLAAQSAFFATPESKPGSSSNRPKLPAQPAAQGVSE